MKSHLTLSDDEAFLKVLALSDRISWGVPYSAQNLRYVNINSHARVRAVESNGSSGGTYYEKYVYQLDLFQFTFRLDFERTGIVHSTGGERASEIHSIGRAQLGKLGGVDHGYPRIIAFTSDASQAYKSTQARPLCNPVFLADSGDGSISASVQKALMSFSNQHFGVTVFSGQDSWMFDGSRDVRVSNKSSYA